MNGKRSRTVPLESVLQKLCVVEGIEDDLIADSVQCRSHRIRVLFNVSRFGVSCSESRSPRYGDAQRLMLGNNGSVVGLRNSGEFV